MMTYRCIQNHDLAGAAFFIERHSINMYHYWKIIKKSQTFPSLYCIVVIGHSITVQTLLIQLELPCAELHILNFIILSSKKKVSAKTLVTVKKTFIIIVMYPPFELNERIRKQSTAHLPQATIHMTYLYCTSPMLRRQSQKIMFSSHNSIQYPGATASAFSILSSQLRITKISIWFRPDTDV